MKAYRRTVALFLAAVMTAGTVSPAAASELTFEEEEQGIVLEAPVFEDEAGLEDPSIDAEQETELLLEGEEDPAFYEDEMFVEETLSEDGLLDLAPEDEMLIDGDVLLEETLEDPVSEPVEEIPAAGGDEEPIVESADFEDGTPEQTGAGSVTPHWKKVNDAYYWVQADGTILRKGSWQVLGGKRYFLATTSGRRKHGWITYKGKKYYLDPSTGVLVTGKVKIDGYWYYLKEDGKLPGEMMIGFIDRNGKRMFAQDNGRLCINWRNVKGKKYYFDKNREAVSGWQKIGGSTYYFDPEKCFMRTGWLTQGKDKFYLQKDGTLRLGLLTISGKKYYFKSPNGAMLKGWLVVGSHRYYFGSDGARFHGQHKIGSAVYYFNTKWGYWERGWKTIKGKRYYFGSNYRRVTGLRTINGKQYLFDENGALITNKRAYKINGSYCRIDSEGVVTPLTKNVEILAAQRLDKLGWSLPAAFTYATSLAYDRSAPEIVPGGYSQAEFYGEYGLKNGSGHCYMMACVFYELASMLGYRVRFLKGYVPSSSGGRSTHGWVEIYNNGSWYVCDPNFTYNTGRSGYMINYGWSGTWRYVDYYVADQNF